ncbi:MAG: hypothetical protein PHP50_12050 [Lachnospiraceae bacterium]|nr:hypothetical protein [Lachnospiraceae bacterium]
MAIRNDLKEQRDKMKNRSSKEKIAYFWEYYKWWVILPLLVVIGLSYLIFTFVTKKGDAFGAIFLNSGGSPAAEELLSEAFADELNLDTKHYRCSISCSSMDPTMESEYDYNTSMKIVAMAQTGELDVMVCDPVSFQSYSENEAYADPASYLPDDLMEQYKDNLYYDEKTGEATGIYITGAALLKSCYLYPTADGGDGEAIFGVMLHSGRTEEAVKFLEFLNR